MGHRQNVLAFVKRNGSFVRVKGQGLLKQNDLGERFRRMTLGSGAPARKQEPIEGGTVKHLSRPYDLRDAHKGSGAKPRKFAPIEFKL
jgi:hypothetical protein